MNRWALIVSSVEDELGFACSGVHHQSMAKLEDEFPELLTFHPKVSYFRVGEEPPVWRDHPDPTDAQRWRNAELLRRIIHDIDPETTTSSDAVKVVARVL